MSQKILNKRSSVFNKTPLPSQIEVGEIAINFNHENPFLSILDSNGEIQKFLSETKTRGLIQDAKEDIDNSFYTKEEINNMFEAFDPSGEVDLDNYYTKSESDSKYQPISGMSSYLTVASAENLYQPKGNYLTEHQSLENYYTKSEADNKFLTSHQDLSDYAQKSDLDDYLTIASASTIYATKEDLEEFTPTVDAYSKEETDALLSGKSNTNHTHDYSQIQNTPDLSNFATKGEIPDTNGFATKQELEDYQMKSGMTSYLTIAQAEQDLQPKGDYALKSELPSLDGYATEAELANYQPVSSMTGYSTTAHTHSDLATKAELDDYLTIASASTIYATKEELEEFTPSGDNYAGTVWTGTLSEYNNLTVIDTDTLYVITDANQQYVTSGDVESMISGYTNLTEVQTLLEGYSQTGHTHSQYLTETSADTRYARVVSCTQAEYDALVQNDQVEQGVLYCIIEQSNS